MAGNKKTLSKNLIKFNIKAPKKNIKKHKIKKKKCHQ